jgi:hypothetical protein
MATNGTPNPEQNNDNARQMANEIHWVHRATFWTQIGLGLIGIAALYFYHGQLTAMQGQLTVMRGTLDESKRSGEQSTEQMWSAVGNINWMARSMDWSQQEAKKGIELSDKQSGKTLQATIDNFREEQRAWVGLTPFSLSRSPNRTGLVQDLTNNNGGTDTVSSVSIVNTGRTPARKVHVVLCNFGFPPGRQPTEADEEWMHRVLEAFKSGKFIGKTFVSPSSHKPEPMPSPRLDPRINEYIWDDTLIMPGMTFFEPSDLKEITPGSMPPGIPTTIIPNAGLLAGTVPALIFGEITYEDVSGKIPGHTFFCSYSPNLIKVNYAACPVMNDEQ